MGTQDRERILSKVSTWSIAFIFFQVILQSIFGYPVIISNVLNIFLSAVVYVTVLIRCRIKTGKLSIRLLALCILCIGLLIAKENNPESVVLSVLSLIILYCYFIYGQYIMLGKLQKVMIVFGCLSCAIYLISVYVTNPFITTIALMIQLGLMLKILSPTLEKMAKFKEAKRIEEEKINGRKEVSRLRRILFGRTGKLDMTIIKSLKGGKNEK